MLYKYFVQFSFHVWLRAAHIVPNVHSVALTISNKGGAKHNF